MSIDAVIPCKSFAAGKSRLAGLLDPPARQALCERLFAHVVTTARRVAPAMAIHVVTPDPAVAARARQFGAAVIRDAGSGLNTALELARAGILPGLAEDAGLLVLPIDLPLATAEAIADIIAQPGEVVIVPDEERQGTNALLLRGPARRRFAFRFGADSCSRHGEQAMAGGFAWRMLAGSSLSFDMDRPDQYRRWRHAGQGALLEAGDKSSMSDIEYLTF